jgi:hypothetical protein
VEIDYLIKRAYGNRNSPNLAERDIAVIASALSVGAFTRANAYARALKLPDLDWDGAVRIAYADATLSKRYNPDEPRDWHGRWTNTDGGAGRNLRRPALGPSGPQLASNDVTLASDVPSAPITPPSKSPSDEILPSNWVRLPPGKYVDEVADLIEWIANARPEEEREIRREINREFYDVGDNHGGTMLNMFLSQAIKPGRTQDERQLILDQLEHYANRDPALAGEASRLILSFLPGLLHGLTTEPTPRVRPSEALAEDGPSPIWQEGPTTRGNRFEDIHGRTLHRNFPIIDSDTGGIALSIKSIDLRAATYQDAFRLYSRLKKNINSLASFNGRSFNGYTVDIKNIVGRELRVIIPKGSMTAAQQRAFYWARGAARQSGIDLTIIPY